MTDPVGNARQLRRRHPDLCRRARQGGEAHSSNCMVSTGSRKATMFVTNDPYFGGVTPSERRGGWFALPVFSERALRGLDRVRSPTGTTLAGQRPAPWQSTSPEIFQEGLRLPAIKLFGQGQADRRRLRHHRRQLRPSRFRQGRSLGAGGPPAARPTPASASWSRPSGWRPMRRPLEALFDEGERRGLAGLASLPEGRYG